VRLYSPQTYPRLTLSRTEHIEQAQKRDAKIKASEAVPQTNDDVAEPLKISGIVYHEINFNGSSFSRMLISKLTWMEFFRLVGLMIFGYRLDAIKILAPSMEAMGLVGLATSSLDVCTKEVKQVFDVLADETSWPTLVHCTQGKDRTGLIVMLLLFLLKVDLDTIEKDYLLSESELEAERPARIKEISSIGLSEQFALCPPGLIKSVYEHIEERYGGVESYLQSVGVTHEKLKCVKHILQSGAV
jgi:protein-tyrosine phosphatase